MDFGAGFPWLRANLSQHSSAVAGVTGDIQINNFDSYRKSNLDCKCW